MAQGVDGGSAAFHCRGLEAGPIADPSPPADGLAGSDEHPQIPQIEERRFLRFRTSFLLAVSEICVLCVPPNLRPLRMLRGLRLPSRVFPATAGMSGDGSGGNPEAQPALDDSPFASLDVPTPSFSRALCLGGRVPTPLTMAA